MKKENGFTLVELLVSLLIGAIVMAAAYSSYISQQRAYRITESVSAIQQNLRSAMLFIEKDIRMAGFNPLKKSGFGILSISSNSITLAKDYGSTDPANDENGVVNTGETISYSIASDKLMRDSGIGPNVIAEHITNMELEYFDRNGDETADTSSVRSVSVILTANDGGEHTRVLSSLIKCRNMGL